MTASGAAWTTAIQGNLEASAGAGGVATRMLTDVTGSPTLDPKYTRERPDSVRGTVHPSYIAPYTTAQLEELKGLKLRATYPSVPWWLEQAVVGGVSATMSDTSAYTRIYTPTAVPANGNDRKTAAIEIGDASGYWTVSYGILTKLGFNFYGNKAMEMSADYEFQKRTTLASLTTLAPVAWETINGSTFKAFLDSSTLGATAFAATEASFELVNHYVWQYTGDGNLYPSSAIFTGYSAKFGMTVVFNSQAEYTAWNASTERKARILVEGSLAGAATAKNTLNIDWYGYWDDPVKPTESGGVLIAKLGGECFVDTTATKAFEIKTICNLVTLP